MTQQTTTSNGTATTAFIVALLSICIGPLAFVGLILGAVAWRQTYQSGQQGMGLAVAATFLSGFIITSWFGFLALMVLSAATS
jgi:ABC-type Fe3+-siderophore transport system permease subunit